MAKQYFKSSDNQVQEVFRGKSKKPLYVTSVGFPLERAALHIAQMAGAFRFPELLKILDRYTKE